MDEESFCLECGYLESECICFVGEDDYEFFEDDCPNKDFVFEYAHESITESRSQFRKIQPKYD